MRALSLLACALLLAAPARADDAAESREAFKVVYEVLMHPRCLNCHPSGDRPLQGDDSHVHAQNVKRGDDGNGLFALKCSSCHQTTNLSGAHTPPGAKLWRLPEREMPLVFQGRTPAQLAAQLKDPEQNGGKTLDQLVKHITADELVLWGWDPGPGRAPVNVPHAEFAKAFREWVAKGAAVPEK